MNFLKNTLLLSISIFLFFGCVQIPTKEAESYDITITPTGDTLLTKAKNINPDSTLVTPVLDFPIRNGQNVVFCATVHLAWDKLEAEVGGTIQLRDKVDFLKELNEQNYLSAVDEEDYIALYGTPDEAITEIVRQMKEKFGKDISKADLPPVGSYLLYSYLWKYLPFKVPFRAGTVDFKNQKVQSIYGDSYEMNKQGDLIFYSMVEGLEGFEKGAFILRINSRDNQDEIVIAQLKPDKTLEKTFEKVNHMVTRGRYSVQAYSEVWKDSATIRFPIRMNEDTYFEIPKFDFKINHRFEELEGNHFSQIGKDIDIAEQSIRFKLDEYGAVSESYFGAVDSTGIFKFPDFKIQDRFLIYLKQKNADLPYLVIWVDNAAILERN